MTKLMHSLPWTLALTLAAQAGESEAIRIPFTGTENSQECSLDATSLILSESENEAENMALNGDSERSLYERIKKSLEM